MTAELSRPNTTLRVLQFTDMHFFKDPSGRLLGVDTASTFAEVFASALDRHGTPDFYLLTGDLSQDETAESYRRLARAMNTAGAPSYFIPGNHDRRSEMAAVLPEENKGFRPERRLLRGNWQIILLDTLVEGEVGGHLEAKEIEFMQTCLEERPDLHALVCLHHHPIRMGTLWLDNIGVDNGDEFMEILLKYTSVRGLLWGHVHQEFDGKKGSLLMMATPSTCVQFKVGSDDFGVDPVPPGYRWLELEPTGLIRSAVVRLDKVAIGLELSSAGY